MDDLRIIKEIQEKLVSIVYAIASNDESNVKKITQDIFAKYGLMGFLIAIGILRVLGRFLNEKNEKISTIYFNMSETFEVLVVDIFKKVGITIPIDEKQTGN